MEDLELLYDTIVDNDLYSKSFDEFKVRYEDEGYQQNVWKVVSENDLYSKSFQDFQNKYNLGSTMVDNSEIVAETVPEDKIKVKENIKVENFDNIEEEDLVPKLKEMYGDTFDIKEQLTESGYKYDQVYIENKATGEGTSIRLNTDYNKERGQANENAYSDFISFVDKNQQKSQEKNTALENVFENTFLSPIADYYGDIYRSVKQGWQQGELVDPSLDLYFAGEEASDEEVLKFVEANKDIAAKNMQSDEMQSFNKIYEEEGGGWWGFVKGVANNPSVLPTTLVSSLTSQVSALYNSEEVAAAGVAGAAGGAAIGAGLSPYVAGAGALPGIGIGLMTGTMTALETGLTFSELLQEEIEGELTKEKVKEILNDPEKLDDLKTKARNRGLTIGAIELATAGIARGVGGRIASKAFKGAKPLALSATATIEAAGGGIGEVGGRVAAGQEMDVAEIGFEAFSGVGGTPLSTSRKILNLNNNIDRAKINTQLKSTPYNNLAEAFDPNTPITEADVNISKIKNANKILNEQVNNKVKRAEITKEQGDEIKNNFRSTQDAANKISKLDLNTQDEVEVISLLKEKQSLVNKIKSVDESSLTETESIRVNEINNRLKDISTQDTKAKVEESIKFSKQEGKKFGLETKVVDTQAEMIDQFGEEAGQSDGFIADGTIYINKEVAENTGAITVGSHELLHGILNSALKGKDANKLVNDFKNLLDADQLKAVDSRLLATDNKGNRLYTDEYLENNPDEFLTAFSDAVAKNEISFKQNVFTKLGDLITPILRSLGFSKIKFNTGKDVYNFLRDYNKSIKEGKLSQEITSLADTEISSTDKKFSRTEGDVVNLQDPKNQNILNGLVGEKDAEGFYTMSKKDFANSEAKKTADILLDNKAFDKLIGKKILVTNPNKRQEILEESRREIEKHIGRFNPKESKNLFGYINSYIENKVGTAAKTILKAPKTISTDKKIGGIDSKVTVGETLISDEISPEEYTDIKLAQDKLKKTKPQQSAIAKKLDLTENEINLAKRDVIGFLRKSDRPAMTDAKKFFKALVDYTTGKDVQPGGFAKVIYDKLSLPKDGRLSTKNREAFIRDVAEDLIALNKVDPAVMRRSKWTPFYELEIKNMNPTQTQKAIDEGRVPSTTNLKSGLDLFKTLDPSVDEVVDYLMSTRPDVLKRKMPKFLGEVVVKNEFNEIVENPKQPVYDSKGNKTDNTIDLSESITEEEVVRGAPQVREKIARPQGVKFSNSINEIINIRDLFELETNGKDKLLKFYNIEPTIKVKNIKDIDVFIEQVAKPIFKLGPKEMFFGPDGGTIFTSSAKNLGLSASDPMQGVVWKKFVEEIKKLKNDNSIEFGSPIPGVNVKDMWTLRNKYNTYFSSPAKIKANIKNGNISDFNNKVGLIHEVMWNRINNSIKKDKNNAKGIATYLGFVANDTGHWHKIGAKFQGYSKNIIGKRYEYEHAMPATAAYLYLLDAALNKNTNFEASYDLVIENYKLIALDKAMDNKLRNARTKKGYSLQRRMPDDWSVADGFWWQRYFNDIVASQDGGIDPNSIIGLDGKNFSEIFNIDANGNNTTLKIQESKLKAKKVNIKNLSNNVVKFSKSETNENVIKQAATVDQALDVARDVNAPVKKIRVFDFDDTLATTKSNVLYTKPDGTEGKLTAEQFAKQGAQLLEEGYAFDFSEFNKVTKGKPGPLLDIAKKIQAARGTEDVFVLTARAPESAVAIKEFLDTQGLNIPLENITGLGNSTGVAKANWIVDKAAKGYNDFYFADDAYQNVKAVKDALSVIDVKSKVQQAKFSLSKDLNSDFNKILENKSGIGAEKVYSDARAKTVGASKGKFKFFIPPSAEDFVGLLYPTLAKGKLGDQQMAWYKERLLNPFARAMENLSTARVNLMADFKALKKELDVPKDLRKEAIDGFTNEQAVRVYLWNEQGMDIPGISKRDLKELTDVINNDPKLKVFADQLKAINKMDGYPAPNQTWLVGTITTDLINGLNTVKRAKYLEEWQTNADIIFSKENLNKMEAIYGPKYREAMENMLSRMKTGKNRLFSESRIGNQVLDYINGSIGAIMFFNTRSAVLQTISSINFINWSDNNIYKAGKAFANQKQYWKDFTTLMNSDFLKDRRQGLKLNISESEIADAAQTSKNKAKAAINYLLQKGFLPTQIADSFAIASGGATFYRNKINSLMKDGMSQKEAEAEAYVQFREVAEESQQSSRADRISQQQASNFGRIILAFANTPSQYARIIKKSVSDLKNKRGDWRNNVSKIVYYGAMQNLIFNVLQQALFAIGFGDDDEEKETREKKYINIGNGMADSLLRGLGIGGAAVSVAKNLLLDLYERSNRKRPEYVDSAWKLLDFSPPIDSKISKLKQAGYMVDKYKDDMINKGFAIDNPAYEAAAKIISATTNIPVDRLFSKIKNIEAALSEDAETWQRVAMMLGWPEWQIKPQERKSSKPKTKEQKDKIKLDRDNNNYKAAQGSNDYDVLKKLNKAQQVKILKNLGYGKRSISKAIKEDDRIKLIQKAKKEQK